MSPGEPAVAIPPARRDPFDWAEPEVWVCPRCMVTLVTKEGSPRCPRCGFKESDT